MIHSRWEAAEPCSGDLREEGQLIRRFWLQLGGCAALTAALIAGIWRLRLAALTPPLVVGVAAGQVFTAAPDPAPVLRESDFEPQFRDTVTVLFTRTESGILPQLRDFCAAEVIAAVERDYRDTAARFPAGFVQTFTLLEEKALETQPGVRRRFYRGLLGSRSQDSGQLSPVYLECTFAIAARVPANPSGWRLVRVDARQRDDFYRDENDRERRRQLGLDS